MAKFQNYIDQFLEDIMPDMAEVNLGPAAESGKEQLERTHDFCDEDFLEGLSDDTNQHTQGPRGGKGTRTGSEQAADRIAEKEASFPRIRSSQNIVRTAKALGDESVFSDVVMELEEAKNHGFTEKREISEAEVQRYVKRLLNGGMPPAKIAMKIKAELELFQHNMATDYLNRNAGLLGLAYIQPNEYMNKCPDTYERLKVKGAGKIAAKSVKQINACENCMFFSKGAASDNPPSNWKECGTCGGYHPPNFAGDCRDDKNRWPSGKTASSKTCNLYHLPIVGTQNELLTVVNKMTAGVPTKSKKAALVQIANKDAERTPMVNKIVSSRPAQVPYHTSPDAARQKMAWLVCEACKGEGSQNGKECRACHGTGHESKKASFTLTASHVEKLYVAGNALEKIYNWAVGKVGSAQAGRAVREFVASLKTNNTKIALSQIDCTFLKGKLGVQNAIVGAAKCGSCVYRQGMHCGMTGGTLVGFPGMDKQASNHKIAADAPKDGRAMLQEYDMTAAADPQDIEINASGPERAVVQMGNTMTVGDIE